MFMQIDFLTLADLKPSEAESRDAARWICDIPRLRKLAMFGCSFHGGFYSQVKAGAPSLQVSLIIMLLLISLRCYQFERFSRPIS